MFKQINNQFQIMSRLQRRIFWGILMLIAGAGCYIVLYLLGVIDFGFLFRIRSSESILEKERMEEGRETVRNAFDIALPEARKWHADAVLASLVARQVGEKGRSDNWELVFVSPSTKGKGYLLRVEGQGVLSREEISYQGIGADFPVDLISPEEAIKQARQIKGYENVKIQGVEAIYGQGGKIWYWGVRTSKGVVSMKARP